MKQSDGEELLIVDRVFGADGVQQARCVADHTISACFVGFTIELLVKCHFVVLIQKFLVRRTLEIDQ